MARSFFISLISLIIVLCAKINTYPFVLADYGHSDSRTPELGGNGHFEYHANVPKPPSSMRNMPNTESLQHGNRIPRPHVGLSTTETNPVEHAPQHVKMLQPEHFRGMRVRLVDAPIGQVAWAVKQNERGVFTQQVAFVVTKEGKLYRSTNAGETWDNESEKIGHAFVLSVHVSPADAAHVIIRTKQGVHFFSNNAGESLHMPKDIVYLQHQEKVSADGAVKRPNNPFYATTFTDDPVAFLNTFKQAKEQEGTADVEITKNHPLSPHDLRLQELFHITNIRQHPTNANYILASTESSGCFKGAVGAERARADTLEWEDDKDDANKHLCFLRLMLTKDNGRRWIQIATHVIQFDWASAALKGNEQWLTSDSIFVAGYLDNRVVPTSTNWDRNINFVHTKDFFNSHEVMVEHGNRFHIGKDGFVFVVAVDVESKVEGAVRLMTLSKYQTGFQPTHFPVDALAHNAFNILDSNEGQAFVMAGSALSGISNSAHLYTSDENGVMYSLSLPNVVHDSGFHASFVRLRGLEGIFLANFVSHDESYETSQEITSDPDALSDSQFDGSASGTHSRDASRDTFDKTRRIFTSITFNKGGEWFFLDAPRVDANGNPIHCEAIHGRTCKLHLHSISHGTAMVYSDEKALGLVLGTGSIGHEVQHTHMNTYLSRDGGLNWHEIFKGSHIYEFGDRGGLIVMAKDDAPTDTLLFSWDEGATWEGVVLTDTPFMVRNIITEPNNTDTRFVIQGYIPRAGAIHDAGILVYIDFADLHTRQCQGIQEVGSSNSDFEWWTPHDGRLDNKCLMGHTTHVLRRKQFAKCFSGLTYAQIAETNEQYKANCQCTTHDFACDYGFVRTEESGPCVADPKSPPNTVTLSENVCAKDNFYFASRGYRKVVGNTCVGGDQWLPERKECPSRVSFQGVVCSLLLLGGIGFGVWEAHKRYDLAQVILDLVDKVQAKKAMYTNVSYTDVGDYEDEETGQLSNFTPYNESSKQTTLTDLESDDGDVSSTELRKKATTNNSNSLPINPHIGPLAQRSVTSPTNTEDLAGLIPKAPENEEVKNVQGLQSV